MLTIIQNTYLIWKNLKTDIPFAPTGLIVLAFYFSIHLSPLQGLLSWYSIFYIPFASTGLIVLVFYFLYTFRLYGACCLGILFSIYLSPLRGLLSWYSIFYIPFASTGLVVLVFYFSIYLSHRSIYLSHCWC